jgi:hypothetical protein
MATDVLAHVLRFRMVLGSRLFVWSGPTCRRTIRPGWSLTFSTCHLDPSDMAGRAESVSHKGLIRLGRLLFVARDCDIFQPVQYK